MFLPVSTIFPVINFLTSSRYLVMTRRLDDDTSSELPSVPIPFAPPSDEFCTTNTLGDDFYVSLWEPCKFVFFNSTCTSELGHYTCDDTYDPSQEVSEAQLQVLLWPDSCVANGPRYYLMKENPELKNYVFDGANSNPENYTYSFPEDTAAFSVSCAADFAAAKVTLNNMEGSFNSMFHPFVGMTILCSVLGICFCLGGGICCCCCVPLCKKSRPRQRYRPNSPHPGDKTESTPLATAVVV